jgi:hypothetical protein
MCYFRWRFNIWSTENDRYHTVQEFNKGVYDYIIATDESGAIMERDSEDESPVEHLAYVQDETEC